MMIKFGKWLSIVVIAIFAGSFLMGTQVASETSTDAADSEKSAPAENSAGDGLFEAWLEKNTDFNKPTKNDLKQTLTSTQYDVTQKEGTERPFQNEYWDNKQVGIYVDIISGEPLFSSTDKFKSGTGWPSFTQVISQSAITTKQDLSLFGVRTELRSRIADSHLGHVFDDGPAPTGQRFCINSASLKFIPKDKLAEQGYEEFAALFE